MTRNQKGRVPVTLEMIEELARYQEQTGFGITALFRYIKREALFQETKSFTPAAFNSIVQGKTETVFPDDFAKVIAAYKFLPPEMWGKAHGISRRNPRIPVSDAFKAEIRKMFDEAPMSRNRLLKLYGAPPDLTSIKIGHILNRQNTTIKATHAEFLERMIAHRKTR